MPVINSPTCVQAVHPDGDVAVARAAGATNSNARDSSDAPSKDHQGVIAGAFGKDHATTSFHVLWVGAITGNMTRVGHSPQFFFVPADESDVGKVCAVFDGGEVDIAGGELWAARDGIRFGLDLRYDRAFYTEVDIALSEEQFHDFIQKWSL